MRILMLGAGGFIGSNLVEHLCRSDVAEYEIVGVDISDEKVPDVGSERFTFHNVDFTEPQVTEELRRSDVVIDLVAYANPSVYVESPLDTFRLNFLQNLQIVEACVEHGKRLIQYSTCEVYGRPSGDVYSEDHSELICGPVTKQRWIYSAGKQLLERVIHAYGLEGKLDYGIIRPFNFIGPRFDYLVPAGNKGGPRVFAQFMSALLTGGPMRLVDGGRVHRAFLHVGDGVRAFDAILDRPERSLNRIFNVGNPANNVTVRRFAELMLELYEEITGVAARSDLEEISGEAFYGPGYEDSDRLPPDISKLRALGWEPRHDLRTTLKDAMLYYLRSRGSESGVSPRLDTSVVR